MKIIERYVLYAFIRAFFLSWLILSFVLTIGLLVKITQLMIDGLPVHAIGLYMFVGFPETLTLTLPLALLISSLLVFSRLSADSEIAAMRASGVNLLLIMKWPVFAGTALTLLGVYINNEIVPRSHEIRSNIRSEITMDVGLNLLEPGRIIDDFPGFKLFFEKKQGNWLSHLIVFDYTRKGVSREIQAEKALVSTNGADVVLDMYKVRVDPVEAERPGVGFADRFRHVIPNAITSRKVIRKDKDMRLVELLRAIRDRRMNTKGLPREIRDKVLSVGRTEFHLRFVYAFASLCFVLVGMPLGIRTHRKESSIGMAVCLIVAMSFYLCVILVHSLDYLAVIQPFVLLWIPVAACVIFSAFLVKKNL